MATTTIVRSTCDRCSAEIVRESAFIIEAMTFTASGYDHRSRGGRTHRDVEFCQPCSREFYTWFNTKGGLRG